jgi:hypothetical protein
MVKLSSYPKGRHSGFEPLFSDTKNDLIISFKDLRVKQSRWKEARKKPAAPVVENLWIISEQCVGIFPFHYAAVVYNNAGKCRRSARLG